MTSRSSSTKRWIFALIPLFMIAALAVPAFRLAVFATSPGARQPEVQGFLMVTKGLPPVEIAKKLEQEGMIDSASQFLMLGKVMRQWKSVKMGEYAVRSGMTPTEIFQALSSGVSVKHPVTIREGQNMFEVADALAAAGLATRDRVLELCRDSKFIGTLGFAEPRPTTLEGYLFPDTYHFTKLESPESLLQTMVKRYRTVWSDVQDRLRAIGGPRVSLTEHEAVTLASMIEKETGAPEERPLISSVFHNRLKKRMRLQSDPTTIYGIWETYGGNITRADLRTPTPFNTYTVAALPAGPISNPGSLALESALNPAVSEYLFFVSTNDGRHAFTRSLVDHNAAVKKYQLDPKAREGKSWRNLSRGSR